MNTDDILTQIDNALEDGSVSYDAMRSRPGRTGPSEPRPVHVSEGARQVLIGRLVERHGLTRMTARHAVLAAERGSTSERAELVRIETRLIVQEMTEQIRAAFLPLLQRVAEQVKQIQEAFRHLPEATGCNDCSKPAPPRDRPAWQSPYGPARRRR